MAALTLVTGASGFIGSHVAHRLLEKGEPVRLLVRSPERLAAVGLSGAPGLDVVQADLLDPSSIGPALEGVSRLYHIAGFISTAPADRKRVYRLNVEITKNLFEACKAHSLDKIVYLASIFALAGGQGKTPVTESAPYNLGELRVDYVRAKREAELYAWQCVQEGLPLTFVYPCFCYGPGDVYLSSSRLVLMFLRRQLPAFVPGGQNAMDVRDAAAGLVAGMERGEIGERYLIGGENRSYDELFGILSELTGYRPPRVKIPRLLGRWAGRLAERFSKNPLLDAQAALMMERHWYYDDAKARRELGYASRPLRETLEASARWFCEAGLAPWPERLARR